MKTNQTQQLTKGIKMYNIYNELNCHIAYVSEEELEQFKEDGLIQDTDRIEKDEYGYSD